MEIPFTFSDQAISQLKTQLKTLDLDADHGVRLSVRGGKGCLAVEPIIGIDKQHKQDKVYALDGFNLFINNQVFMHLVGYHIDYVENETEKGFVFEKDNLIE